MSALSSICDYGDISSEDSDSECENILQKRPRLPPPKLDLVKVSTAQSELHQDNPALHAGRTRTFPHVRGNWATFVYVNYPELDVLTCLINKFKSLVLTVDETGLICDNIHLSLSRTVVLKYHLITAFTTSLQEVFSNINSFNLQFNAVEVYCNDENTRTFIALKADHWSEKFLLNISRKVDKVLEDLKLPPFYEEPSFHSSVFWVNGNKRSKFEAILDPLNEILNKELEKNLTPFLIDRVHCKVGHRHFQYCLK